LYRGRREISSFYKDILGKDISLLKRTHSREDRRFVYVQLTQQGHDFKEEIKSKSGFLAENIKKNISVGDLEQLQAIVNKIAENRVDFRDSV